MNGQDHINDFKKQEIGAFNLRDLISKYGRYLPYVIISLIVGLLLAYFKIRYATSVYEIKSSILIKNERSYGSNDDNKFMNLFMSGGDQNVNNELEILKSRPLIGRVVTALNLQIHYYNKGRIKTSLLYRDIPFRLGIIKLNDSSQNFSLEISALGMINSRLPS